MPTFRFFRDSLTLNDTLLDRLSASGITPRDGDTLVLGAATCTLSELSPRFNYVILADKLVPETPTIALVALGAPAPAVNLFAKSITSALHISVTGSPGEPGRNGADGREGRIVKGPTGKPMLGRGFNGSDGARGGDGGPGGTITIRFGSAPSPPTAIAPGGSPGARGLGGAGGFGRPPGKSGRPGAAGSPGLPGSISVSQVPPEQVFENLDLETLRGWSEYRTQVGEYHFRLFDPRSQLHALAEFDAALELDPENAHATTLRQRLIRQQTPGGSSRDLDMSPDYKDVSAGLLGETQLVLAEFLAVQQTATQEEIANAAKHQLDLILRQLKNRIVEAQHDVVSAKDGIQAADAQSNMYSAQITDLQQQIFAEQHKGISLGGLITTLGEVAGVVAGIASGAGAIVAIPGALAVAEHPESGIVKALGFLADGKSFWDDKDVGGDLSDLISGGKDAITNFSKVYDQLNGSDAEANVKRLALQKATVTMQLMISDLRRQQARDQLVAAEARVANYGSEVQKAQELLNTWSATQAFLQGTLGAVIDMARALSDLVAEDVFLARRALEIYQLDDASSVHFEYGWLHPDQDHDLTSQPLKRVQQSLRSVAQLPVDVITWSGIFVRLNEAQTSGFDVVHPAIEVVIDDDAALAHLREGRGVAFAVGVGPTQVSASIPANIFELKVNDLNLELVGASATGAALLWVQHSGHWIMARRPSPGAPVRPDVEFSLFPHVEAFNFRAGAGTIGAAIPAKPQSNVEPGPPFSFWGRGALAEWTLFADRSATALNLASLRTIRLTIGCIGLVAAGTVVPRVLRVKTVPMPVAASDLLATPSSRRLVA
jgi:hypothetical protein